MVFNPDSQLVKLSRDELLLHSLRLSRFSLNLEFGVFEGKTINLCANHFPEKVFYGFDSFRGLPENWRDGFPKGLFDRKGQSPGVASNVRLLVGEFEQSIPQFLETNDGPASFIHIDCDLYSSTQSVLRNLSQRLTTGTIIVFDEYYNYPGWEKGEFLAWSEFSSKNNIKYEYVGYNPSHQQASIRLT